MHRGSLALVMGMVAVVLATEVIAAETKAPPEATKALGPAIAATVERFNKSEERLRDEPDVESVGDPQEPSMLRATYRRAGGRHQVIESAAGATPTVVIRVRASEIEKRATNVNAGNLEKDFAKAPWRETPRGYLLDFRLRWNGTEWEQVGEPVAHPTLGIVGKP